MSDRTSLDRRSFLRASGARTAGLATAVAFGSPLLSSALRAAGQNKDNPGQDQKQADGRFNLTKEDVQILVAAEIAEALAVTTYTGIINSAFFTRLADDDQGYLQ